MKKYVIPAVEALSLSHTEMLCVSGEVTIDPSTEVGGGFDREQGWNASEWEEEK